MDHKSGLTKLLSITGTVLIWITLIVPVLFTLGRLIRSGSLLFDYLLPLELFPLAVLGGALLTWSTIRARSRRVQICVPLAIMAIVLIGGQVLAVLTGLASGETGWTGAMYLVAQILIDVYILALLAAAVAGSLLVRDLYKPSSARPVLG